MSERSYFAEGRSDPRSTSDLQQPRASRFEVSARQLHRYVYEWNCIILISLGRRLTLESCGWRRKSSSCAVERYYSLEASCHSFKAHSDDAREQDCDHEGKFTSPAGQAGRAAAVADDDDDLIQTLGIGHESDSSRSISAKGHRIRDVGGSFNFRAAWSDSEVEPEKRTNQNWLQGNSSNELHGKESACGNSEVTIKMQVFKPRIPGETVGRCLCYSMTSKFGFASLSFL